MKAYKHFCKIIQHKRWVGHFCFKCGLYKQGIFHDMSKFSPTEFIESAQYFVGTYSPIDACKKDKGYSLAWLHHKGRNKHHWEYWCDNFEKGLTPIKMPYNYALEMVCDFLGAGVAYSGGIKNFSMEGDYKWWLEKRKVVKMHPDTKALVDLLFTDFAKTGINTVLADKLYMDFIKTLYNAKEGVISEYLALKYPSL